MRHIPRALLAGGLGFAVALLVAACGGSSGLLSSGQSATLNNQLASVASAIDSKNCTKAGTAAQNFDNDVSNLPSSVSPTLTQNLKQASAALAQQAEPDCQSEQTTSIPTTTRTTSTPTTTKTTATTGTASTQTQTQTQTTQTQTGPATTGTAPGSTTTTGPSGGAGLGNGGTTSTNGGGGQNGNGNAP
jgi:hypothetical protein